jgi:NitT/TauT family transport system substrate-binding protein
VHVDVRRGDDPSDIRFCTFAGLVAREDFLAREPEAVDAAVRAIVKAQKALREEPARAREVGARKFPPESAALIADVVARDCPFYDPAITEDAVRRLNAFAQSVGHLSGPVPYENVVAVRCRKLWAGG